MTPKTAVLHIGTRKTGTTSIQRCLAQAQGSGSLGPVCYPLTGDGYNQGLLSLLYVPYEQLPSFWRRAYEPGGKRYTRLCRRYRESLFGALRAAGAAVLSSEDVSANFSSEHAVRLREDLESLGFRQFRIVLYVRDPADYFLSETQQGLKAATSNPYVADPATFRYEFVSMAETWERAFPGSLMVRKYHADPQWDVVADFAGLLNECFGVTLPRHSSRANVTHSAEAMQILQDYREAFWPDREIRTPDTLRLIESLNRSREDIAQTKPALQKEIAELIRANHRADAEVLFSRYGVDLDLRDVISEARPAVRQSYRVEDILATVDPDIVRQLLLWIARAELCRPLAKRSLPMRAAARAYRAIPPARRPVRLVAGLATVREGS